MKKVQIQITPVFTDFNQDFWVYTQYSDEEIAKIDHFFQDNWTHLQPDMSKDFNQNFKFLNDQLGCKGHPCFIVNEKKKQDEDFFQNEVNKDFETYIIVQNMKIDYANLKCLQFTIKLSPIGTLKMVNNSFSEKEFELVKTLIKESPIKILFLENYIQGNKNEFLQAMYIFYVRATHKELSMLVLRANGLMDENIQAFMEALQANEQTKIQCLELSETSMTEASLGYIAQGLMSNNACEYLSLPRNNIKNFSVMWDLIKQRNVDETEVESFRARERERDAVIAKNSKAKANTQKDKVPYLENLLPQEDGRFVLCKNYKLQKINLSVNKLTPQFYEELQEFLPHSSEDFRICLAYNPIDDELKDTLQKKYSKKIEF